MIDFNDYEDPGYIVLVNILPDFEEAYGIVNSYTTGELNYLKNAIYEGRDIDMDNIESTLKAEIQYDIIVLVMKSEFETEDEFYKFYDKYMDEIGEYAVEIDFISRADYDSYYIDLNNSFVESFLSDIKDDNVDNYKIIPINKTDLVNTLNKETPLKFII